MRIGSHVSVAGGVWLAPGNAAKVGCEVFQIFSRSPHGGPVKPITPEISLEFAHEMKKHKFDTFYIHAPYFINLSSVKNNIYYGSISVLREELERGSALGCKALMTHIGSFGELTDKEGINKVINGIEKIMDGYRGSTQFLLEMSAGAGRIVGDTFEEIAAIIFDKRLDKMNIGACFDTCHAYASGYDISTAEGVEKTIKRFDKVIGLDKLILIHANDSKGELGKHLDRHEHIGKGGIGIDGFKALVNDKAFSKLDWILETPKDDPALDVMNIAVLKKLQD